MRVMFSPQCEVRHISLQIKGTESTPLFLNILTWQEEGQYFAHCLELDICGYGKTLHDALHLLAQLIDDQMEFSKTHHTQLFHPAPPEYWQKVYEIQANRIQQFLLSKPLQFSEEMIKKLQHADV